MLLVFEAIVVPLEPLFFVVFGCVLKPSPVAISVGIHFLRCTCRRAGSGSGPCAPPGGAQKPPPPPQDKKQVFFVFFGRFEPFLALFNVF